MNTLKDLLNDNIINKSELILKRHEYLGLDAAQAAFLSKIFVNNKDNYSKISIDEIANCMSVDIDTANSIISSLVTNGMLGVSTIEGETTFDFEKLVSKLVDTYSIPSNDSLIEVKLKWITNRIDFELTNENKIELEKLVNNHSWETIVKVIEKFEEQSNKSFPLLISLISLAGNSREDSENQIKSVIDINWLE